MIGEISALLGVMPYELHQRGVRTLILGRNDNFKCE